MSVFRASLPITTTSFINKCGTIGLGLIPMILVERNIAPADSAAVIGAIKAAALLGIGLGGWLSDRFGLKTTLLASFWIAGAGLLPLTWVQPLGWITFFAALSQVGTSIFPVSARLMVTEMVPAAQRQEAIAWQRTGNNFGSVVSYSIAALASRWGVVPLLAFDAATSFLAAAFGWRVLPEAKPGARQAAGDPFDDRGSWTSFLLCAILLAGSSFLYEVFMVGAAARSQLLFGSEGIAVFSRVMIINTVLCAGLSVVAARRLKNPRVALPTGMGLMLVGLMVLFSDAGLERYGRGTFYFGSLLLTFGEIAFNALSSYVLITVTPPGRNRGSIYSSALLIQFGGRILGGMAAFPFVVHGTAPFTFLCAVGIPVVLLCAWARFDTGPRVSVKAGA